MNQFFNNTIRFIAIVLRKHINTILAFSTVVGVLGTIAGYARTAIFPVRYSQVSPTEESKSIWLVTTNGLEIGGHHLRSSFGFVEVALQKDIVSRTSSEYDIALSQHDLSDWIQVLPEDAPPLSQVVTWGCGWPAVSASAHVLSLGPNSNAQAIHGIVRLGPQNPRWPMSIYDCRWIPTDFHFTGILTNLVFFIVTGLVLSLSFVSMRFLVRQKQGRCGNCGYVMVGLIACPECGLSEKQK